MVGCWDIFRSHFAIQGGTILNIMHHLLFLLLRKSSGGFCQALSCSFRGGSSKVFFQYTKLLKENGINWHELWKIIFIRVLVYVFEKNMLLLVVNVCAPANSSTYFNRFCEKFLANSAYIYCIYYIFTIKNSPLKTRSAHLVDSLVFFVSAFVIMSSIASLDMFLNLCLLMLSRRSLFS